MIDLGTARERTGPIHDLLVDSHRAAAAKWRDLVQKFPAFALPLDETARAKFHHCHACAEIEQRVAGRDDAFVTDRLSFFALWLPPDVLLRVKWVGNSDGTPHNYPTNQQRLLERQSFDAEMLELLGVEAAPTLLTCGYTLDGLDLGVVEIRRDCKGHQPWSFSIFGEGISVEPLVLDGMADDTKPARVTSSRNKQRKDEQQQTDEA